MSKNIFIILIVALTSFISSKLAGSSGTLILKDGNVVWAESGNWDLPPGGSYPEFASDTATINSDGNLSLDLGKNIGLLKIDYNPDNTTDTVVISGDGSLGYTSSKTNFTYSGSGADFSFEVPVSLGDAPFGGSASFDFLRTGSTLRFKDTFNSTTNVLPANVIFNDQSGVLNAGNQVVWEGGGTIAFGFVRTQSNQTNGTGLVTTIKDNMPNLPPTWYLNKATELHFVDVTGSCSSEIKTESNTNILVENQTANTNVQFTNQVGQNFNSAGTFSLNNATATFTKIPFFTSIDLGVAGAGGSLIFDHADEATFQGNLTSTSSETSANFIKKGSGTLTLTGTTIDFPGQVQVQEGSLILKTTPTRSPIELSTSTHLSFVDTVGSLAGNITGTGSILVQNDQSSANLTFTGSITNSGIFQIDGGSVTFNSSPSFSSMDLGYGGQEGSLTFNFADNLTYSGNLTSSKQNTSAKLVKTGEGSLILSGSSIQYPGQTDIEQGSLQFNTIPTQTSSFNVSKFSTLIFNTPAIGTTSVISAPINGLGGLTMSGAGKLQLSSGESTYQGTTTVNAGVLSYVKTPTQTPTINIADGANLEFAPAAGDTQTYNGLITGDGGVSMNGSGTQNLAGSLYNFASTLNVNLGTLHINQGLTVTADVNVNSGVNSATSAVITGLGTLQGNVNIEKGVLSISDSDSTLTTGNYTNTDQSTLRIPISTVSAGLLEVVGTASLNGTLELELAQGAYLRNATFTVLNTTEGFNPANFSNIIYNGSGTWIFNYINNNSVTVTTPSGHFVHPVSSSTLSGNELRMFNYMFTEDSIMLSSEDLANVAVALLNLPSKEYKEALIRLSSEPYAAYNNAILIADVELAKTFDPYARGGAVSLSSYSPKYMVEEPYEKLQENILVTEIDPFNSEIEDNFQEPLVEISKANIKKKHYRLPCFSIVRKGAFIQPIGIYYNQRAVGEQIPFDLGTYGFGAGWTQTFNQHFFITGGAGYTHTKLKWENNFGNSKWSTLYFGPIIGCFNRLFFTNFGILGAFNFVKAYRTIVFTDLYRVAKSRYNTFDLLLRLNGGLRVPTFSITPQSWIQPEITLNYLTIFTQAYSEQGANDISLQIKSRTNYLMQPSFRARFFKEFITKKFCYAPSITLGWLANIPLNPANILARFTGAPNQSFFNITGYNNTTNQLILGASFLMSQYNKFELRSDFEVDMLSQYEVYNFKLFFKWVF